MLHEGSLKILLKYILIKRIIIDFSMVFIISSHQECPGSILVVYLSVMRQKELLFTITNMKGC